jgi:hypothetical protein
MEVPTYFKTFLTDIRPTENQRREMKSGHTTLRDRLRAHASLKEILISDFLQGSYRRSTAIRPKGENRSDVDVIVVTNLNENNYEPQAAMDLFVPFLEDHYKDKWKFKGRSIGINLSYVDLDMVITSAPSEADVEKLKSKSVRFISDIESEPDWVLNDLWIPRDERSNYDAIFKTKTAAANAAEWKLEPLRIPDREAEEWDDTDPLEQIKWTVAKNATCNTHYINIVKALKWWRRINDDDLPKYPKGYPLEHIIGDCCPDGVTSVAAGVTLALEEIVDRYAEYAELETTPFLGDRGVPAHNVLHRLSGEDFKKFYEMAKEASKIAREALDEQDKAKSVELWRKLFGNKFPECKDDGGSDGSDSSSKGFTPPTRSSRPTGGNYA